MTAAERWLVAVWPVVLARLPASPARVLEIGCGSLGGFVPMLRSAGYDAVGVDPEAPEGVEYRRLAFERAELFEELDAVVASTSLHHVADPAAVLDRVAGALAPAGTLVVIEWAWEEFDELTADWCFQRLRSDDGPGWLDRRREEWLASGQPWGVYLRAWAERERLHDVAKLVRLLDERFEREQFGRGPYFFADLADTTAREEQLAIDAGQIQATRIDYVGRPR